MGTICLDSLLLQGPIQFKSVSKLSFSIKGNEHGHLVVTGFLDEDSGSSAVYKDLEGQPFGIYSTMVGVIPIFIGVICASNKPPVSGRGTCCDAFRQT